MKTRATNSLLILAMALLLSPAPALAAEPATQPVDPAQLHINHWVEQLADGDATVRDRAKFNLMGLSRDQLPALRQAVIAAEPLTPGQQTAVRDVVLQVYLSEEWYDMAPAGGFLGLTLRGPREVGGRPTYDDLGLVVQARLPGFCAYRYLHDGDIILKILDHPEVDCRNDSLFKAAVSSMTPGDTIHLRVLRQGEIQNISVVLDHAPAISGTVNDPTLLWLSERRQLADDYWQDQFAPFMPEGRPAVTMK